MTTFKYLFSAFVFAILIVSCGKEALSPEIQNNFSTGESSDTLENFVSSEDFLLGENALLEVLSLGSESARNRSAKSLVFTLSNEVSGNKVIVFERKSDGTISESGRYSTGGTGTDGGLGNQGALAISTSGKFLYVVNPGSNDISVFYVSNNGELTLRAKADSGGERPVSIAYRHGIVYVLNAGGEGNISGFAYNYDGAFIPIPNSTRALSSTEAGAAQISFSANGRALIVTEKATNMITSFKVQNNGRPGDIKTFPSSGKTPFGFAFRSNNRFFVSEPGGGAGNSVISSYRVNNSGDVSLVDGSVELGTSGACWVALNKSERNLFVTNTGSSSISSLRTSGGGNLTITNDGKTIPAESGPIDAILDRDSEYLYVLASGNDEILSYKVEHDGGLTQIDTDGGVGVLPNRMTGIVVR